MDFVKTYNLALKRKRWNCVTLSEELMDRGHKISPRTLQRYKKAEMLPNQEKAEYIMKALDVPVTPEQIAKSLADTRTIKTRRNPDADKYIERGLRLPIEMLSSSQNEENAQILLRLKERIRETEPNRPNLNRYLTDLIRYDLEYHMLPTLNGGEENETKTTTNCRNG